MEIGMGVDPNKNFDLVNKMRRNCPPGYQKRYLNPEESCSEQFTIGTGKYDYFYRIYVLVSSMIRQHMPCHRF